MITRIKESANCILENTLMNFDLLMVSLGKNNKKNGNIKMET